MILAVIESPYRPARQGPARQALGFPWLVGPLASLIVAACVTATHDPQDDRAPTGGGANGGAMNDGGTPTGEGGGAEADGPVVVPNGHDATSPPPEAGRDASSPPPDAPGVPPDAHLDAPPGPVDVAGTLKVGNTLFVDGDTNDPRNGLAGNDSFSSAQPIASPSQVGGYVGTSQGFDDPSDFYQVTLAAGQSVLLYIGIPGDGSPAPDLDLYLYDAAQSSVDESTGGPDQTLEVVTAPSSGTYFVEVRIFDFMNNPDVEGLYTVSAGQRSAASLMSATRGKLSAKWPAVPGEALVRLAPGAQSTTPSQLEQRLGIRVLSPARNALGIHRIALPPRSPHKHLSTSAPATHDARSTLDAIKRLKRAPEFSDVEPNYIRQPQTPAPDDPLYPAQWHYPMINFTDAWDETLGEGTIVAILDTGIVKEHPDFQNTGGSSQLIAGYDMVSDATRAADGDGRDADPEDPGDRRFPSGESSWHGTHTAGTVAAATDNGVGCAGVAPASQVMPVRVLGVGGGVNSDIVQGILYAAGLANDTGRLPAQRANVISMSLGGFGLSNLVADAVAAARKAGTIVVASSGNNNQNGDFFSPAAEPGVVGVSAVDLDKARAFYSNYGSAVDVAGPGGDESHDDNFDGFPDGVLSLVYARGGRTLYTPYQGTSMAAPHVAGVAALMKSIFVAMTPADFDQLLAGTFPGADPITEDLGPAGRDDDFGYGLINASRAVRAARQAEGGTEPTDPVLSVSTQTLDFGSTADTLPLSIDNIGPGTLTLGGITADQPWVSVSPGAVGDNMVTVDRSGLSDGVHTATLTIDSNGGSATVTVRVSLGTQPDAGGDVGIVYVLLVDPDAGDTRYQTTTRATDGYDYQFSDVAPGQYFLVAGTDLDDNGVLDDDGEAFGAYPLSVEPQAVDLESTTKNLDFALRFLLNLQTTSATTPVRRRFRRIR